MLVLFKKDNFLYAKCLLNLKRPIKHQNKSFNPGAKTLLLLPEEVNAILAKNGNIKMWNGKKFIKLNLGEFNDILVNKKYKVEEVVEEPKVEQKVEVKPVVKQEPKKVENKQEPKKEIVKEEEEKVIEIPVIVEPKQVIKEEIVVKEEEKKPVENKKQRHKQNNQQGGDK